MRVKNKANVLKNLVYRVLTTEMAHFWSTVVVCWLFLKFKNSHRRSEGLSFHIKNKWYNLISETRLRYKIIKFLTFKIFNRNQTQ